MFKVMDYLAQAQHATPDSPELRALDTRGNWPLPLTPVVLIVAILRLLWGRATNRVAGVHVHVAERLSVVRKGIIVVLSRQLGIPVILHVHAAQLPQFYKRLPSWGRAAVRYVFSVPAEVVVLGEVSKRFVVDQLQVPESRVTILINGVPAPPQRGKRSARPDQARIVFLGNLSERKGVIDLLNALARPELAGLNWRATFGGGGDVARYRAAAVERRLQHRVDFPGWQEQAQACALLSDADILVLPSYDEGLPLVILEAFARHTAVICTPVGEIPNELVDGQHALFVQAGDVAGIASALVDLIKHPQRREALATAGRALYDQRYSMDVFFENLLVIYRRHLDPSAFKNSPSP
jgi:glycosyltransferase involved in cell wall biosynthesis